MTRPQRYLTRVLLFLAAVIAVIVALVEPLSRAFSANPALNGLIAATLVIGIGFSIRQIAGLKGEVRWIEQYRRAESVDDVQQTPALLAPMAAMLGEDRQLSLSALSMRTLLDGIAARMDEAREITRYLIGLLIFLGLLGTFWGLLGTISAISDTIRTLSVDSPDIAMMFDELKQGLQAPLSGMGTAFSSSLFGLAGSVILGFIDLQTGQAQNRFFKDLEDWLSTITKLSRGGGLALGEGEQGVPSYVSALLEQTAESLDNLQRTVTRAEESRGEVNAAIMTLTERLETLADQRKAEQDLLVKLADAQNGTRDVIGKLTTVLEAGGKSEAGIDEATRSHLRNLDVHVKHMMDDAAKGRSQFVDEIRSELKLLARTLGGALDQARAASSAKAEKAEAAPSDQTQGQPQGRKPLIARRDDGGKGSA